MRCVRNWCWSEKQRKGRESSSCTKAAPGRLSPDISEARFNPEPLKTDLPVVSMMLHLTVSSPAGRWSLFLSALNSKISALNAKNHPWLEEYLPNILQFIVFENSYPDEPKRSSLKIKEWKGGVLCCRFFVLQTNIKHEGITGLKTWYLFFMGKKQRK